MAEKFGKYQIISKIATGGMAEVFRAKITGEKGFEKLLVIKKVLPHLASEDKWIMHFTDEAKLAALLQHENIIHIYDFGKIDETWYIAMEYLAGRDLKEVMIKGNRENNPPGPDSILQVMKCVCDGLDYAHDLKDLKGNSLNIIHRDISPQNIFITFDGKVKIIDFGIAKAAERSVKTQIGTIKGKLSYMSPEQAAGKEIDHRSDIFSAGIIFYELLTGKRMYKGEMSEILMKVVRGDYEAAEDVLSGYPTKIIDILNRALAVNPDDRYSTAGDMLSDIETCMFENNLRTGSRKLADYMKSLYSEEYIREKYEPVETQDYTSEKDYQKTKVMIDGDDGQSDNSLSHRSGDTVNVGSWIKHFLRPVADMRKLKSSLEKVLASVSSFKHDTGKLITAGVIALTVVIVISVAILWNRNTDLQVKHYLSEATRCFDSGLLTEPADDSALYYYQKILDIDDDNDAATDGVRKIVMKKTELAELMLSRFRHKAALEHIADGLQIDPENQTLLELKHAAEQSVSNRVFGGFRSLFKAEESPEAEEGEEAPEK